MDDVPENGVSFFSLGSSGDGLLREMEVCVMRETLVEEIRKDCALLDVRCKLILSTDLILEK